MKKDKPEKKEKEKRILVVDDDPKIRKFVVTLLKKINGVRSVEAENGLEAIQKIFEHKVYAVITDLEMPEMNGLEFLGFIKTNNKLKNIPVIFLTSKTDDFHKNKAERLGVSLYLTKPVEPNNLTNAVKHVI